ncbi:MAG: ATPase domain-containing protein, partial [Acutalibacteraceae bacterium]
MAKARSVYVCSECGNESVKWQGRCSACGNFNTFVEQISAPAPSAPGLRSASVLRGLSAVSAVKLREISAADENRYKTGMTELDRVLGGGIVKGSLVLLSGDPGIGKSTIILQMCQTLGEELRVL